MNSNLPVVNVKQFTQIVELQFKEGNKRPIFGLGKGGIGKTESILNLAKRLEIGYIDIRLLMYSEVDLKGIPYPNKENTKTIWLQNNILPNEERDGKRGILVLDEITSVARSVRTAAYQLLNERRLGEYVLPDGWMVVCLGNGEEDGGDFQGMEGNFANRCSIYNVVPDIEAWKTWAYQAGVNYLVLGYLTWRPSHLHTYDPESETDLLFASPRSWKAVSDILNVRPYNENDNITNLRIVANIGSLVGNQFLAFCKYKESVVDPIDIISGKSVRDINNTEVLFMTMQGVITLLAEYIKKDKINYGEIRHETMAKCANGIRWILSLGSMENKVMGLKDFLSIDRAELTSLMVNPEFNQLCPELVKFATENKVVFKK